MLRPLHAAVLAAALVGATSLAAQANRNVDVLSNVFIDARGNDVWGHVDPGTGKEYAIVGNWTGTLIFDCSDPTAPILRGTIPSDNPTSSGNRWRDMKTYGSYCYSVSEAHGGVQIIDLTNPDQPFKVKTWGSAIWQSTHNIAMDLATGIAYACGTNNGMHMFDVSQDPINPTYLGQYNTTYVHDLAVKDGLAHLCDTGSNRYTIIGVNNLPSTPIISQTFSAGSSSCHSIWPTRDHQIVAVCHETSGGQLVMYDVSNPAQPQVRSIYQTGGPSAIIHNPMIVDRVCHVAWNTEGLQCLDLSDPDNPVRVGFHDTWNGPSSGFNGMWGVFAGQPSGVVYGNDRTSGLFVFKPKCTLPRYGDATAGNATPKLYAFGSAWVGNQNFRIDVADANQSQPGVLVVSQGQSSLNLQGLEILVDFAAPHLAVSIATDSGGEASVAMPLAANLPTGIVLYAQAFVVDAAAPLGLSASQGMQIEFFSL